MAIDAEELKQKLTAAFPEAVIHIRDLVGDQDHYHVEITSERFRGMTRVQQHKLVHQSLHDILGGILHAMSLTTSVP